MTPPPSFSDDRDLELLKCANWEAIEQGGQSYTQLFAAHVIYERIWHGTLMQHTEAAHHCGVVLEELDSVHALPVLSCVCVMLCG